MNNRVLPEGRAVSDTSTVPPGPARVSGRDVSGQEKGFVTMSTITRRSTAMSTRAISRIVRDRGLRLRVLRALLVQERLEPLRPRGEHADPDDEGGGEAEQAEDSQK